MELGEKLRQARIEAGMTQRQLAGSEITRNMLSQIENGSARPSMKTLQYLAGMLGKSVSYFLEEEGSVSPNQSLMESARRLYDSGGFAETALILEAWQSPDPVFDREKELLWVLSHLALASQALEEGREPYALSLLKKAETDTAYCSALLNRQRLLLLGRIKGQKVSPLLPSLDEELLLRAGEALEAGNPERAARLLDAAEDPSSPRFSLLRGRAHLALKEYTQAAACFHAAENSLPQTAALLEQCYKELGDYKRAYEYACKQRQKF